HDATPVILEGLQRLEYRGYDSAGIAVLEGDAIQIRRGVGKLATLRERVYADPVGGFIGIGHTRWATHGVPAERNAHPHISMSGDFVVVHNGIVENYLELRAELIADDVVFQSETDTEVIVHLVERCADANPNASLIDLVRDAAKLLRGAHAIVVMSRRTPDTLVAVRIGNAAQTLHPVAGQGLNLGLRDAYALVDALRDAPPFAPALRRIEWSRAPDRWTTIAATDFLARSFTWRWPGLSLLRGGALAALDAVAPAKSRLARQMMFGWR
ncbi:MAG: hypothetical protein F9K36_13845, partial [Burkholderiaceae bacterium]